MKTETPIEFPGNQRVHIALAVTDLARSRTFYETLLGESPAKERPGYVKFEPQDPSLNLTLNEVSESPGVGQGVAHYGIQVKTTQAVQSAIGRLAEAGLQTEVQEQTACCYAVQDKAWVTDPDGNRWEVFVVLEADVDRQPGDTSACCPGGSTHVSTCC